MTPCAHLVATASTSAAPAVTASMAGLTGRAALVGVLLLAATLGWGVARRRAGTFRATRPAAEPSGHPATTPLGGQVLTAADLGHALGERATFVQFSTRTCATCPQVRRVLGDLAAATAGVTHVEVDAEQSMDLVRRVGVLRTPTVLLVGGDGAVLSRTSGPVTGAQAAAALDDLPLPAPRRTFLPTTLRPPYEPARQPTREPAREPTRQPTRSIDA